MKSKREKTIAILVFAILAMSFMGVIVSADMPIFSVPSASGAGSPIALWTTTASYSGQYSVHLYSGSATGSGAEGRLTIMIFGGMRLGDLHTLSWYEYLLLGYPPHVDVILDIDGDGNPDESLNFEYAYNSLTHYAENGGLMPYGAVTGGWYQTFNDDGNGPSQIDDSTFAWPNSGPPGPPGSIQLFSLSTWKAGVIVPTSGFIDKNTVVLGFEIEVDNWVVDSEAYLDDVELNGINIFEQIGPQGLTGATGLQGIQGETGPQGIQGVQGDEGPQGDQGIQGETGATGATGAIGPEGDRGSRGYLGSTGPQGELGLQGLEGETGATGSQGIQGVLGPCGVPGDQGDIGLTGVQGERGEQGLIGEQGATGSKGATGRDGESASTAISYGGITLGGISLLGLIYVMFGKQ